MGERRLPEFRVREKSWGRVTTIAAGEDFITDLLEIEPGYTSSLHRHHEFQNRFYVHRGQLVIASTDYATGASLSSQVCLLNAGEMLTVSPGKWHQFYCPFGAVVLETYYRHEIPGRTIEDDIERA